MRVPAAAITVLAALILGAPLPGQDALGAEGKLDALESKLKNKKKRPDRSSSSKDGDEDGSHKSRAGDGDDVDEELVAAIMIFLGRALLFPWWSFKYQSYPYEGGEGYLDFAGDTPWTEPGSEYRVGRAVTGELRTSYVIDSEVLQGYRFYGKARLSCWITFDLDVTRFHEWVKPRGFTELTFTKIDVLFNVSNSPWHDFDFGFGISYMEGIDLFGGPNAKATLDVFPVRPLAIHAAWASSAFDGGTLHEAEIGVGIMIKNVEVRVGYRRLWVEGIEIGGPMAGVAFWF